MANAAVEGSPAAHTEAAAPVVDVVCRMVCTRAKSQVQVQSSPIEADRRREAAVYETWPTVHQWSGTAGANFRFR